MLSFDGVHAFVCYLQSRPNCNAILLTTEITTPAYYKGKDKHRQVTNMIFRTGASAVLFSNKRHMVRRAKYVLDTNYRVHLASRDPAYKCIWYGPDEEGNNGEGKAFLQGFKRHVVSSRISAAQSVGSEWADVFLQWCQCVHAQTSG
jgi:hypothetical protein